MPVFFEITIVHDKAHSSVFQLSKDSAWEHSDDKQKLNPNKKVGCLHDNQPYLYNQPLYYLK